MLRSLYRCALHLHPPAFRKRFEDEMLAIFSQVRRFCRPIGMAVIAAAPADDPKALAAARRISSAHTVAAIAHLARADRRLAMTPDEFDADTWFMNTEQENDDGD